MMLEGHHITNEHQFACLVLETDKLMDWIRRIRKIKGEYERYYDSGGREIPTTYIGRACYRGGHQIPKSKWHNPFTVKDCKSVEEACWRYEEYIRGSSLLKDLPELDGKILLCWCRPGICHGDVLQKLLSEYRKYLIPKEQLQMGEYIIEVTNVK